MSEQGKSAIASSTVEPLFPTFVWRAELAEEVRDRIHGAAISRLRELTDAAQGLPHGKGWQSEQTLHRDDAFAELVSAIESMARGTLRFLRVGHEGFQITGCWANIGAPGAGHPRHHHPNNFLSGAYYVQVQPGADTICFHEPRPQMSVMRPPVTELTGENTDMVVSPVKSGTLLLFPAWLEHSVQPNESDALRISISFNIMFSRFAETMSPPMWESGYR